MGHCGAGCAFLGDVDEVRMSEIKEKLAHVCGQTKPFEISFDRVDFAPPGMPPRMVWAVFQESKQYAKLVEEMREKLKEFFVVEPHKELVPHATLARFNDSVLAREIDIMKAPSNLASFDVQSIDLVESRLTPEGAQYKTIETFLLGKTI